MEYNRNARKPVRKRNDLSRHQCWNTIEMHAQITNIPTVFQHLCLAELQESTEEMHAESTGTQ